MAGGELLRAYPGADVGERLADALDRALDGDPLKVRRLGHARTSVAFIVNDARVVLLLDRHPPILVRDVKVLEKLDREPAERASTPRKRNRGGLQGLRDRVRPPQA